MTVKELRDLLATMEDDMTVVFEDSWTRGEGWRPGYENATFEVTGVITNDNGDCELITDV